MATTWAQTTKEGSLRNECTGQEPNAAAVLATQYPVDGVSHLLVVTLPQLVGDKDLLPAETNNTVHLQPLTTTTPVLLTVAATVAPSHPNNLQNHGHRVDGRQRGAIISRRVVDRVLQQKPLREATPK